MKAIEKKFSKNIKKYRTMWFHEDLQILVLSRIQTCILTTRPNERAKRHEQTLFKKWTIQCEVCGLTKKLATVSRVLFVTKGRSKKKLKWWDKVCNDLYGKFVKQTLEHFNQNSQMYLKMVIQMIIYIEKNSFLNE